MTGPDAEQLANTVEQYVAARIVWERLRNPEATQALQEARDELVRVLQQRI
jgi:hypothetical protein